MLLPPVPSVPDDQRATGTYPLRFADLTQDGRLQFEPIVASIGAAIWTPLLARHPHSAALHASGVRPIFTRVAIEATSTRLERTQTLTARGVYELAHDRGPDGAVSRLYLNMWTEVQTQAGGEPVTLARLFAEHVLTRPMAPPEQRRVTDVPGLALPATRYHQPPLDEVIALPEGASWLEASMQGDAAPAAFGVLHTDINHHVNSLVYPRLFEEAALRRFASLGKSTAILGRTLVIAFRKPFLAGQSARIALRAYAAGDKLGACGVFTDPGDGDAPTHARAHSYVRIGFEA